MKILKLQKDKNNLKNLKSKLSELSKDLNFNFISHIKKFDKAEIMCSKLNERKFDYKKNEQKKYTKFCEKINSTSYNLFKVFQKNSFFESEFKTDLNIKEYFDRISTLNSAIDNQLINIEKKLAEEKRKKKEEENRKKEEKRKAEEKRKEEEKQKKIKEAEEKKKKEEAKKKKRS